MIFTANSTERKSLQRHGFCGILHDLVRILNSCFFVLESPPQSIISGFNVTQFRSHIRDLGFLPSGRAENFVLEKEAKYISLFAARATTRQKIYRLTASARAMTLGGASSPGSIRWVIFETLSTKVCWRGGN